MLNGCVHINDVEATTHPELDVVSGWCQEFSAEPGRRVEGAARSSATLLAIPQWVGRAEYSSQVWFTKLTSCITEVVVFEEWRYYTAVVRIIVGKRTCKVVESSFTPCPCKCPDVLPRISMCDTHSIDISIFKCQVAVREVYICLESM